MCEAPSFPKCFPAKAMVGYDRDFEFETPFGDAESIRCPSPCPDGNTTTPRPPYEEKNRIFKRKHHGGMLIMTNFCLMPVCSFIARFFKETFNVSKFKGVKMWFWVSTVSFVGEFNEIHIITTGLFIWIHDIFNFPDSRYWKSAVHNCNLFCYLPRWKGLQPSTSCFSWKIIYHGTSNNLFLCMGST